MDFFIKEKYGQNKDHFVINIENSSQKIRMNQIPFFLLKTKLIRKDEDVINLLEDHCINVKQIAFIQWLFLRSLPLIILLVFFREVPLFGFLLLQIVYDLFYKNQYNYFKVLKRTGIYLRIKR